MTMEQVVTQLQQEVFTLIAQVADQSGQSDAVRAFNSLASAQGKKDTLSLIDVKGLGRPKESSKEEDFQQWSKKTEAFFAGVIMVRDDVGVVNWTGVGSHNDSHRLGIHADCDECGTMSSKPGACAVADAYSTHGSHEL